jgi:hypothetical protein
VLGLTEVGGARRSIEGVDVVVEGASLRGLSDEDCCGMPLRVAISFARAGEDSRRDGCMRAAGGEGRDEGATGGEARDAEVSGSEVSTL